QCVNNSFCILCLTGSRTTSKSHSFYHPGMRLESLACRRSASRWRGEAQARFCSRVRPAQPEGLEKAPCEDAFMMINPNEAIRSGKIHLSGLRGLLPHLNDQNHEEVLAQAAGKSKRDIEELVARLAPKPPVPTVIRKLPDRGVQPALTLSAPAVPTPETHRP